MPESLQAAIVNTNSRYMGEDGEIYENCAPSYETPISTTAFNNREEERTGENVEDSVSSRYIGAPGRRLDVNRRAQDENLGAKQIPPSDSSRKQAASFTTKVIPIILVTTLVNTAMCAWIMVSFQNASRPSSQVATNGNLLGPNQTKLDTLNDRLLSVSRILAYHDELLLQSLSSIEKLQDELRNRSVFISGSLSGCSASAVCGARGGFLYSRGKCYIYILQSATYDQARRLCLSNLSALAEFEDRAQEMEVLNALKNATNLSNPEFWIGMRYISRSGSGHVQYASGRQVSSSQFKWHENSPSSDQSNIVVEVSKTDQNHFGLWTYDPSTSVNGALCEMTF